MHRTVVQALAMYDLIRPELSFHGWATNVMYRVRTGSGDQFALRIASPGWRSPGDLRSEAMWLNALARDTSIGAPSVVPANSGDLVPVVDLPDAGGERSVTLMTWVYGRSLAHYLTETNLAKMGELFARLHEHGATWVPPAGFTARRFEHWLSRGEGCLIVDLAPGARSVTMPAEVTSLPAELRGTLERLHASVESAYRAVDRADLRVIHCDLWHENIKVRCGALRPFDFEDTVWGFRAHDIAMAMLDLLEAVGQERYGLLLHAFRQGYTAHMAWPADPIEPFQVGRLLWKANWVARHRPQRLRPMIESHMPLFRHYERTGQVLRPPV